MSNTERYKGIIDSVWRINNSSLFEATYGLTEIKPSSIDLKRKQTVRYFLGELDPDEKLFVKYFDGSQINARNEIFNTSRLTQSPELDFVVPILDWEFSGSKTAIVYPFVQSTTLHEKFIEEDSQTNHPQNLSLVIRVTEQIRMLQKNGQSLKTLESHSKINEPFSEEYFGFDKLFEKVNRAYQSLAKVRDQIIRLYSGLLLDRTPRNILVNTDNSGLSHIDFENLIFYTPLFDFVKLVRNGPAVPVEDQRKITDVILHPNNYFWQHNSLNFQEEKDALSSFIDNIMPQKTQVDQNIIYHQYLHLCLHNHLFYTNRYLHRILSPNSPNERIGAEYRFNYHLAGVLSIEDLIKESFKETGSLPEVGSFYKLMKQLAYKFSDIIK